MQSLQPLQLTRLALVQHLHVEGSSVESVEFSGNPPFPRSGRGTPGISPSAPSPESETCNSVNKDTEEYAGKST